MFRKAVISALLGGTALALIGLVVTASAGPKPLTLSAIESQNLEAAPDLDGGVAWLNHSAQYC